jgi:hypothetical protein
VPPGTEVDLWLASAFDPGLRYVKVEAVQEPSQHAVSGVATIARAGRQTTEIDVRILPETIEVTGQRIGENDMSAAFGQRVVVS